MPTAAHPTILNVDDNEMCRYAVTRILELHQFRVREAGTGSEALNIARRDPPDLVLLDIHLPDMSGLEVCRILKSEPATAGIPVLHITASSVRGSDVARGLEGGADSYLTEPVEPEVLIATINSVLRARRAEESARKLVREWQVTFDAIGDGVAVVDAEGRIVRVNAGFAELAQRPGDSLTGAYFERLWGGALAEPGPFAKALEGRRREVAEIESETKLLAVTVDPIIDEFGRITGAVCIIADITERRRLEEQFRESQKFETVGTLAAGVAHDFNNLLTGIMGNASLMLGELPGSSPFRDKLEDVVKSSQRAADLTRQLLAYSGKGRHFMQKLELSQLVRRMENLIQSSVPKKVTLQFRIGERMPRIDADANQIQQILLNLVSNAAEAIGEGAGTIEIATGSGDPASVFLEVRDTGCGMDAETRARIFDPFFTTKFTGRGLGLAAVAGIARSHKAVIHVASAPGEGSTFRITFPASDSGTAYVAPPANAAAVPDSPRATVLVVDDEEMIRRVAQASLELRGYRVRLASNGREAIEAVRKDPEISVVLLDLTMPVMNGEEAIGGILEAHPGLKVVVSTGYDHREAVARFGSRGVAAYLQKPYAARQLVEKIESVLGPKS